MGGSAYEAALTSFMLFALGAIVPILPFILTGGRVAVIASVGLSGLALFAIGAAITIFTGVTVWRSGSRQLALGLEPRRNLRYRTAYRRHFDLTGLVRPLTYRRTFGRVTFPGDIARSCDVNVDFLRNRKE